MAQGNGKVLRAPCIPHGLRAVKTVRVRCPGPIKAAVLSGASSTFQSSFGECRLLARLRLSAMSALLPLLDDKRTCRGHRRNDAIYRTLKYKRELGRLPS